MPVIRSSGSPSKSEREASTETDWSLNTPASSATRSTAVSAEASAGTSEGTAASRYTISFTPTSGRTTRAASALAAAAVAAPPRTMSEAVAAQIRKQAATRVTPPETTTANPCPAPPAPSASASTRPAESVAQPSTKKGTSTRNLKNIGGKPAVPPFASTETLVPKTQGARSTKSTRKLELEARREYQKKQLEVAQSAATLAQIEWELTQCQSEEELDEDFELEKSTHVEHWVEETTTFLEKPKTDDKPEPKSDIKELAEAIISAARTAQPATTSLKKIWDLPDFNGSYEEWLPFKRAYEDSAALCTDVHNMARLRKVIKGTAKEAIRSLLFMATDPNDIIAALERRFGRPEQLVLAEMQKIKELPRIGDTPRDICIFSSRVSNAVTTITALKKPHYLHSPEMSLSIVEKLSSILRYRWLDYSARMGDEEPELLKLKKFLEAEADLCGKIAPPELPKKRFGNSRYPVHTTREEEEEDDTETHTVASTSEGHKKFCTNCEGEHWLTECKKFKEANTNERWDIVVKKKLCFKCLRRRHTKTTCRGPPCKKCKRPHHIMLHSETAQRATASTAQHDKQPSSSTSQSTENEDTTNAVKSVYAAADGTKVYLKMIKVDLYGPNGSSRVLALLDEGSTVSLLDKDIACSIGATGREEPLILETVGGKIVEKKDSQTLNLKIKGAQRRDKRTLRGVRTVEDLKLSPQYVNRETVEECSHLKNIQNELLYEKQRPTLLIGQDNWDLIISRKVLKGKRNEPVASLTSLGWVLHGYRSGAAAPVNFVNHCRTPDNEEEIEGILKRHFDLDSIGIQQRRPTNDADERALKVLQETTKQLPDGRYESGLLWRKEDEELPNNYAQAHNRLLGIEKKLDKEATLKQEYNKQMQNLLASGYAEKAPADSTPGRTFYLPHFAVVHPQKKKTRIVFDAAAKYQGKSLNDALLPGPDLLQSLFGVLLRFREGPVAVVADIKEMFLQIRIREIDRNSLRFLWRGDDRKEKPTEYRMKSVIFGAASSPATAIFVKNLNAQKHEKEHPEAARAIIRSHYMDDYLQSFATTEEAAKIAGEVYKIHREAGFELRQWASNAEEALAKVRTTEAPKEKRIGNEEKTLGMRWIVDDDSLAFNIGLRNTPQDVASGSRTPTKREITSAVMSTFDPMGLVAPVLITGKKLMQDLWRTGVKWDEPISAEQTERWTQYVNEVKMLQTLKIPRCLAPAAREGEMHTFVDASETTYAAAVYWRTTTANGEIHIALMAGKARVAPVKTTSIPRLELQAALLGARLATNIAEESELKITSRVFWSDSTTVLQWIKADPRRFKTFVAHRLAEIEDVTKPQEWRWVPTKDNPADDATRKVPKNFDSKARWFTGPAFLYRPKSEWPIKKIDREIEAGHEETRRDTCATARTGPELSLLDPSKFSSWKRLLRTAARIYMFIDMCRRKDRTKNIEITKKTRKTRWLPLETEHLKQAENILVRQSQRDAFGKEIENLKKGKLIEGTSRLKRIDVVLNEDGVLCLNCRTVKIQKKQLPILDGKSRISQLLIEHYHRHLHHGNHATVINELRQKYWILSLRDAVRQVARRCQWCITRRSKPDMPPQGNLPIERLAHHQRPFTCVGVDYFGPMHVTIGRRREKRWGALFTCLTTRAVHLELAASLSTSSMIMALRRMAARRGSPKTIFSDNGTNFVGARNELQEEAKKIKQQDLIEAAEKEGMKWKFIPPGAPNMGGAWERMVRTVKTALAAVLQERSPPEEVLHTLLTEVEHIVNSRPLTHLSADPEDEESLTPNHFLIGRSCGASVMAEYEDTDLIGRASWKTAQRLADHFWSRWMREYLPTLMPRKIDGQKTAQFKKGDVVIIADSSLPRSTWPRGIIEEAIIGPDGRTRIVNVKTKGGLMRRPVSRLIRVVPRQPLQPTEGVPGPPCTGGENVSNV